MPLCFPLLCFQTTHTLNVCCVAGPFYTLTVHHTFPLWELPCPVTVLAWICVLSSGKPAFSLSLFNRPVQRGRMVGTSFVLLQPLAACFVQ